LRAVAIKIKQQSEVEILRLSKISDQELTGYDTRYLFRLTLYSIDMHIDTSVEDDN